MDAGKGREQERKLCSQIFLKSAQAQTVFLKMGFEMVQQIVFPNKPAKWLPVFMKHPG